MPVAGHSWVSSEALTGLTGCVQVNVSVRLWFLTQCCRFKPSPWFAVPSGSALISVISHLHLFDYSPLSSPTFILVASSESGLLSSHWILFRQWHTCVLPSFKHQWGQREAAAVWLNPCVSWHRSWSCCLYDSACTFTLACGCTFHFTVQEVHYTCSVSCLYFHFFKFHWP